MPPPPIQVFLTTIASQPALRQRQEYLLRILQVKNIPFTSFDLASDESAKRLWKRKAPLDKQQLPGILVGGDFPGTFAELEEAVEYDGLDAFLRRNEDWVDLDGSRNALTVQPIGVPGASTPLQMTPERLKKTVVAGIHPPSPDEKKPIPVNKRNDFDIADELVGFGLQGVRVTEDELRDLVAELGLEGDDAGELVRGLSLDGSSFTPATPLAVRKSTETKDEPPLKVTPKAVSEVSVSGSASEVSNASVTEQRTAEKSEMPGFTGVALDSSSLLATRKASEEVVNSPLVNVALSTASQEATTAEPDAPANVMHDKVPEAPPPDAEAEVDSAASIKAEESKEESPVEASDAKESEGQDAEKPGDRLAAPSPDIFSIPPVNLNIEPEDERDTVLENVTPDLTGHGKSGSEKAASASLESKTAVDPSSPVVSPETPAASQRGFKSKFVDEKSPALSADEKWKPPPDWEKAAAEKEQASASGRCCVIM